MKIKLVDVASHKNDDGLYVVDFYPDREFDRETHVLLYKNESWGNIQYLYNFQKMDQENTQVTIYCSYVLFPVASLIGHKVVLQETDIEAMYDGEQLGYYNVNRKKLYWYGQENLGLEREWTSTNAYKDLELPTHTWVINILTNYYRDKPVCIDLAAYVKWASEVHEHFDPDKIHCEIKFRKYTQITDYLKDRGDCVGVKRELQKEIIKNYDGNKNYLSYQILSSATKGCRYFALAGAASLLAIALPVNLIFHSDHQDNVSEQMIYMKSRLNYINYGWTTVGFMHNRFDRDSEGHRIYGWDLNEGWRMNVIKHCLDEAPVSVPEVEFI